MKHFIPILLLLFLSSKVIAQNEKHSIFFDYNSRINWEKVEIKLKPNKRRNLIAQFEDRFAYIKNSDFYKDKYDSMFHFMHLNGDSLIDVVFEGWSGGEPDVSKVFYNTGNDFELQFETYQYISELEINKGELLTLKSLDFGCCAEFVHWEKQYRVEGDSLILIKKRAKIEQTTLPQKYFKQLINFSVENSPYHLRFTPEIINEDPSSPMTEKSGNRITEYEKGDTGTAYAKKVDKTGRVWWFVQMDEKKEMKNSIVYDETPNKTKYLGWMSSRFLNELE